LLEGELLAFVYYDYHKNFATFRLGAARAKEALGNHASAIDARADRTDLIHFSSLPWVAFTSISTRGTGDVRIRFRRLRSAGTTGWEIGSRFLSQSRFTTFCWMACT
jgi:chloramphenicol O-acetyltransferase